MTRVGSFLNLTALTFRRSAIEHAMGVIPIVGWNSRPLLLEMGPIIRNLACGVLFALFGFLGDGSAESQEWAHGLARELDAEIAKFVSTSQQSGGEIADDAEWLRRVNLDFTGVSPDARSLLSFLESSDPKKRAVELERLSTSVAMSVRLADIWTDILLPDAIDLPLQPERAALQRWLYQQFSDGRRYDRIVAELLTAEGDSRASPTPFYTLLEGKPEKLAEKTARVFLGVSLDCAQCHDHPFDRWKQRDFWGVAAYFARVRTVPIAGNRMGMVSISEATSGEVTMPNESETILPKPLIDHVESSLGLGTRREQLAIWVTSRQNEWFARATVNRMWSLLMGRGIFEPVDDLSALEDGDAKALLDLMAKRFRESGFDMRGLMIAIGSTEAYSRTSRGQVESAPGRSHDPLGLLRMRSKPLTSQQIAASLRQIARTTTTPNGQDQWSVFAEQLGKTRGEAGEFVGSVLQSLTLQNSKLLMEVWEQEKSKLLRALNAPHLARRERLRWQYLSTLSRLPTEREWEKFEVFLDPKASDQEFLEFQEDLLWAQLNSTEFAMTP